mgnify:CR=1 FL=1
MSPKLRESSHASTEMECLAHIITLKQRSKVWRPSINTLTLEEVIWEKFLL